MSKRLLYRLMAVACLVMAAGSMAFASEMPVSLQLVSDLNGDGTIDSSDIGLKNKALNPSGPDDIVDGTEYLFPKDAISHGIWSENDPKAPSGTSVDDNAKQLQITCTVTAYGSLWFDHPDIAHLAFYPTRACVASDQINFPITLSDLEAKLPASSVSVNGNQATLYLYIREDGTFPINADGTTNTAEAYGNLVMGLGTTQDHTQYGQVSMPLNIVPWFEDKYFFPAANRYILQNDCLHYFAVKTYTSGSASEPINIVVRSQDYSTMQAVDAYWTPPALGVTQQPRTQILYGIQQVQPAYSNVDQIINGNLCGDLTGFFPYSITTTCVGNLITGGSLDANVSTPAPTPPGDSAAGPDGRYIAMSGNNYPYQFTFAAPGEAPTTSGYQEALGGLFSTSSLQARPYVLTMIGEAPVEPVSKKHQVLFTLSYQSDNNANGIVSPNMISDAAASGCPPLPGGNAGEISLFYNDGSTSIALALKAPPDTSEAGTSGVAGIPVIGAKHTLPFPVARHYINTYLIFDSKLPR